MGSDLRQRRARAVCLQLGHRLLQGAHRGIEVDPDQPLLASLVGEDNPWLGELGRVGQLRTGPPAVEPHGDGPERGSRPEGEGVLHVIGRCDPDTVAGADAEARPHALGHAGHSPHHRVERQRSFGKDQVRTVRKSGRPRGEHLDDRPWSMLEHLEGGIGALIHGELEGAARAQQALGHAGRERLARPGQPVHLLVEVHGADDPQPE